jgi:F-type H+-transporting ATPase subunit alpha
MSDLQVQELSAELKNAIQSLRAGKGLEEAGIVTRVGDGVAWIYGLRSAGFNEVIEVETRTGGQVKAFVRKLPED